MTAKTNQENNATSSKGLTRDANIHRAIPMIWRKKWHVMVIFILGIALTHWTISMMGEQFTAQSLVLIKPPINEEDAAPNKDKSAALLLTELQILKSRTLATRVVQRLNLMHDPEFNEAASGQGPSLHLKIINKPQSTFKDLSVNGAELKTLNPGAIDNAASQTVTKVLSRLDITPVSESLAIKASFTTQNAEKSAFIVNAFIDEYIEHNLNEKSQAKKRLANILNKRLIELRKRVAQTERKVKEFRAANNLNETNAPSSETLSALNQELKDAENAHISAKQKLQKLKNINSGGGDLSAIAHLVNVEAVKQLNQKQQTLDAEISELSSRYGPKHPIMQSKAAEHQALKTQIKNALSSAQKTLQAAVNKEKSRIKKAQKDIELATQTASNNTKAMRSLHALEQDAEASRAILSTFLETYKTTLGLGTTPQTNVQILSYANAPQQPSFPDKKRFMIYGAIAAWLLGMLIAFIAAKRDKRIRSIHDLEGMTGIRCNAVIPHIRGLGKNSLTKYVYTNPSSPLTESIRALFIELQQSQSASSKVITFISSDRGDGKTTLCALTAAAMVKTGLRVILIDANLRKPGISDAIKKTAGATLVEYLTGHKALDDIIEKDKASKLDLIFAQAVPNTAFDLISSKRMKSLIAGLRDQYDLIIIDTPACNEVADAKILTRLSDQNVYVIDWKKTTYQSVEKTMKSLHDIPKSALKIALNNAA